LIKLSIVHTQQSVNIINGGAQLPRTKDRYTLDMMVYWHTPEMPDASYLEVRNDGERAFSNHFQPPESPSLGGLGDTPILRK